MITTEITLASQKKLEVAKAFSTSPIKCIEKLWGEVLSVRQALEPDCPIQLSELNRTSPNQIRAAIIKLIERSLIYAGFDPKTMNNDQLVMVVNDIIEFANQSGFKYINHCTSPITGGDGNTEYLLHLKVK